MNCFWHLVSQFVLQVGFAPLYYRYLWNNGHTEIDLTSIFWHCPESINWNHCCMQYLIPWKTIGCVIFMSNRNIGACLNEEHKYSRRGTWNMWWLILPGCSLNSHWLSSTCETTQKCHFWLISTSSLSVFPCSQTWVKYIFCRLTRKSKLISKVLGCRDPRCKHEYLDSPWFDRNVFW